MPVFKALERAFAFALARYRAVPIVSPSAPRKTPFADVRDDEMRTCWRRTSRRGSRTTSETASRLVSRGAAPGLAFLPPFPPLHTPRPWPLQSPHMYALDSRRHSTASSPRRGDFVFARFFQAQDGSTRYETTDFVPTGATPAIHSKNPPLQPPSPFRLLCFGC